MLQCIARAAGAVALVIFCASAARAETLIVKTNTDTAYVDGSSVSRTFTIDPSDLQGDVDAVIDVDISIRFKKCDAYAFNSCHLPATGPPYYNEIEFTLSAPDLHSEKLIKAGPVGPNSSSFDAGTGQFNATITFDQSAPEFANFIRSEPHAGTFKPTPQMYEDLSSLNRFIGRPASGVWSLTIADSVAPKGLSFFEATLYVRVGVPPVRVADSDEITTWPQSFTFLDLGQPLWRPTGSATFKIRADGDFLCFPGTGHHIAWDLEGVLSGFWEPSDPNSSSPGPCATSNTQNKLWEQSTTVNKFDLRTILNDKALQVAMTTGVNVQGGFVSFELIYYAGIYGPGTVGFGNEAKISNTAGGFTGFLENDDHFGSSVASVGDIDGDGVEDLVVGAQLDDDAFSGGGSDRGAVYILFMNANGSVKNHQKISDSVGGFGGGLGDGDWFGISVASLGDIDGDGASDIAVGASADDDGCCGDAGAVWILRLAAPSGTVKASQKISAVAGGFSGALDFSDLFGTAVEGLGDVDGDGVGDLAVGVPADDDGGTDRGAVWILRLNSDGTVKSEQKISDTAGGFGGALDDGDTFGNAIAAVGDLDSDGVGDLAVGAPLDDDGGTNRGAVWILFMNPDGSVRSEQKISDTSGGFTGWLDDYGLFGSQLAASGDLDGDGIADLVVGHKEDDEGGIARGAVWVLFLRGDGTVKGHQKISDERGDFYGVLDNWDRFGADVAVIPDLDGDGFPELAVGADLDDDGGTDRGAVWILSVDVAACGDGLIDFEETCDDGGTTSGDGCFSTCQLEDDLTLFGTAAGGSVSLTVNGTTVVVATNPGDSDADVAAAVALAINTDATLVTAGTRAQAFGNRLVAVGTIDDFSILDPGLGFSADEIKLLASDAVGGENVGHSTAVTSETIVLGAPIANVSEGVAYVFEHAAGGWNEVAKLTPSAPDPYAPDLFGLSVAIAADTIVVGSPRFIATPGTAYVFDRNQGGAGSWGETAMLQASDATPGDSFGGGCSICSSTSWRSQAVGVSGQIVAVGAARNNSEQGAAYVFRRNLGGLGAWGESLKITASDGSPGDFFGSSVAVSGDALVIGAVGDDDGGGQSGSAYVFERVGTDAWVEVAKLTSSDAAPGDRFGESVAISGVTVVVGATGKDSVTGAAYVFERDEGGPDNWGEVAKLTAPDGAPYDEFGLVSASPTGVLVGAAAHAGSRGASYLFRRDRGGPGNWGLERELQPSNAVASAGSVSFAAATAVVGASGDGEMGDGAGAAYVFRVAPAVAVSSGSSVTAGALGGAVTLGGIDASFVQTGGGQLTAERFEIPLGELADWMAPLVDAALQSFIVASDPVQFWEIEYDGSFSGCPSATFPDCVALTFHYDDQSLLGAETELEIFHREDGVWVTLEKTGQDFVNNTITVVTTSFSPFVLSTSASPPSSLTLTGTAQGGSIEVTVGSVFLSVATSAGQTAEQVAAAVAAAINANFTLMDAGITATADGALVSTNGSITAIRIEDPGFLPSPPTIPALGPVALLACVLALWAAGLTGLRWRSSTR